MLSHARRLRTIHLQVVILILAGLAPPAASSAWCQSSLRRASVVQPLARVRKGDFLVGVGAAVSDDVVVPLLDIRGGLTRISYRLMYAFADRIVLEVRQDALRTLSVDSIGMPLVEPDDGLADGKSGGAGNILIGATFGAFGRRDVYALGARFEMEIPSSSEREGLGTNSMGFRAALIGSYATGPWTLGVDVGLAILEAPLKNFEQNDVIVYSAELNYRPPWASRLRAYGAVDGRISTRGTVPIGTEDIGRALLGADFKLGPVLIDLGGGVGYAQNSPDWTLFGGAALVRR